MSQHDADGDADRSADQLLEWPTLTRRHFLYSAGASAAALAAGDAQPSPAKTPSQAPIDDQAQQPGAVPVLLSVNGKRYELQLEPRVTLLDAVREVVGLTGTKKGCDRGQCGACTVLIDGRRVTSCLTLAVMHQEQSITTIEGLAQSNTLHPIQAAFIQHDAFQCGYCTPGQICSALGMLSEIKAGAPSAATGDVRLPLGAIDHAEIRERMSGNICRCGAYPNIVAALENVLSGKV